MFTNLDKVTTEFKINENKRTIVCIITTYDEVPSRLQKYELADSDKFPEDILDIRKYIGVAKCSPEDEWNETYGKRLAEYRAMKLRTSDVNTDIKNFIKGINNCVENLQKYGYMKNPNEPKFPV